MIPVTCEPVKDKFHIWALRFLFSKFELHIYSSIVQCVEFGLIIDRLPVFIEMF